MHYNDGKRARVDIDYGHNKIWELWNNDSRQKVLDAEEERPHVIFLSLLKLKARVFPDTFRHSNFGNIIPIVKPLLEFFERAI